MPCSAGVLMSELLHLKEHLRLYFSKHMPGVLSFLNTLCRLVYKAECLDLLFTSPSKIYLAVLNYYGGDVHATDYVFTLVVINPIVSYIKKPELVNELLSLVKMGRDRDFVEILKKYLVSGVSA